MASFIDLCRLCAKKDEFSKDLLEENNKNLLILIRDFMQITVSSEYLTISADVNAHLSFFLWIDLNDLLPFFLLKYKFFIYVFNTEIIHYRLMM